MTTNLRDMVFVGLNRRVAVAAAADAAAASSSAST